jgi:phosphoribosylformylglycinamidine synthase
MSRTPLGFCCALRTTLLFAETPSRFVVAVAPRHAAAFEAALAGVPVARVGAVEATQRLLVTGAGGETVIDLDLQTLSAAWHTPLGLGDRG